MQEIVINVCFGGFGLSDLAYKELIKLGIPVRKYIKEERGKNGLYKRIPKNEGQIIFDRELTPQGEDEWNDFYYKYPESRTTQRYWESWIREEERDNPLLVKVVKKLGKKANGSCANLKVVKVPDGVKWNIQEYDGNEHIAEDHKTWG